MHYKKCEICGVRSGRNDGEKRIFMAKFPLDKTRCKQWVKVTGNEDLIYVPIEKLHSLKYVCGKHFDSKHFNKKKTRLKKSAIPSIQLKAPPLVDEIMHEFPCHVFVESSTSENTAMPSTSGQSSTLSRKRVKPLGIEPSTLGQTPATPKRKKPLDLEPSSSGQSPSPTSRKRKMPLNLEPSTLEQTPTTPKRKKPLHLEPSTSAQGPISRKRKIPLNLDPEIITPRKRKLIKQLEQSKQKIRSLQKQNIFKQIKSVALKILIKSYIRNKGRKPQGHRWTSTEKSLALAIYKKSPKTYRLLKHLKIALPSIRTLQTLLQSMNLEPGINTTILEHLKRKAAKSHYKDKLCALLFDEIALKKRLIYNSRTDKVEGFVDLGGEDFRQDKEADHALVFMVQGLHKKMKQPVAYYFVKGTVSSENLSVIIKNVIEAITSTGFKVVTTVCDQGPTNIGSLNLLKKFNNLPTTANYFVVNDTKIFIMFDIPHLFKSIRNNFLQGGEIVIDGKKGKWCHLVELQKKNKETLHFKKITPLHVNPRYRSKMKVKYAAQVLSNTVAAILKLLAEKYEDTERGREISSTAEIVELLDKLFDCTNGPASEKDIKRGIRQNVSKKSNHIELWRKYKRVISTMYFLKSDSFLRLKNVRCVFGYQTSLSSLEDIWKLVESEGYKYLNLRQLNQDALENFFGMIRQHCPTNRNPTCHHFTAAFKSNILTNLTAPHSRGSNCEDDSSEAMIDFEDFFNNMPQHHQDSNSTVNATPVVNLFPLQTIPTEDIELPLLEIPDEIDKADLEIEKQIFEKFEKQPTVYVSGYLASRVLRKVKCENCNQSLKMENPEMCSSSVYSYIRLREWWQDKKSLTYPTIHLCNLINMCTEIFDDHVKNLLHRHNISKYAVTLMLTHCENVVWICNQHKDMLLNNLLVRLSHLLIRNECYRRNQIFAGAEEIIADKIKKAQQKGTAK